MMGQAGHMQALVSDLLTLSALESSPGHDGRPVGMPGLIHAAVDQGKALSAGRHALVVLVDEDLDVLGSTQELSSAVSNMLTNAIRYTPAGGTVTQGWQRDADGRHRY